MKLKENTFIPIVKKVRGHFQKINPKTLHAAHHVTHVSYLGAVAYSAHGLYSYCAGGLLIVVLISLLAGEGEE